MLINYLKHRSFQTILVIAIYSAIARFLPDDVHRLFYSISLFIKDVLVLMMPVTVLAFIAYTISSFKNKALVFVLILLVFEFLSNLLSVWYAIGSGFLVSTEFASFEIIELESEFGPLWRLAFSKPAWWGADKGSFLGLALGTTEPRRRQRRGDLTGHSSDPSRPDSGPGPDGGLDADEVLTYRNMTIY